jgi:S1-C subfamily serine protease
MARLRPSPDDSSARAIRAAASFVLAVVLSIAMVAAPRSALAQGACRLEQRFVALRDQVPQVVGECVEAPRTNASNGNVEQRTTKGELVWRSTDNRAVFTNGSMTWIIGPNGLQSRSNSTTFDWEAIPVAVQSPASSSNTSGTILDPSGARPVLTVSEVADLASPSTVLVLGDHGGGRFSAGTGVKIDEGIVTNFHVIRGAKAIQIVLSDGSKKTGKVVLSDSARDVALISASVDIAPLMLEEVSAQKVGDEVVVLGYPRSDVIGASSLTVTRGTISAIRQVDGIKFVQTDASIEDGNSGGPVMNLRGKVIGLATFSVANSNGLNFAISTEEVRSALASEPPPAEAQRRAEVAEAVEAVDDELKMKCLEVSQKQSAAISKAGGYNKDEAAALFLSLADVCIRIAAEDGADGVVCHEKALNALIKDPPKTSSAFRTRYSRQYTSCMEA